MRIVLNLGLEDEFDISIATDRIISQTEYPGMLRLQSVAPTEGHPGNCMKFDDDYNGGTPLIDFLVLMKSDDRVQLVDAKGIVIGDFDLKDIPYKYSTRVVLELKYAENPGTYIVKLSDNNYTSANEHEKRRIMSNIEHLIASAFSLGFGEEVEKTVKKCFE